ncbi:MAG: MFS transporter [Planctomycetes bacterium]|nr:MFS transporter [Planctomycetota bacterium]
MSAASDDPVEPPRGQRLRMLALLAVGQVLSMAPWFSASAVVPQLVEAWGLDGAQQAWLTVAVQLGFVIGALASALSQLADRVPARVLIGGGSLLAAAGTAAIPAFARGSGDALVARVVTGIGLALVYPPAMKLAATWTRAARGVAIGVLVGALTVGSALPHLLNALGAGPGSAAMPDWKRVLDGAALLAIVGGVLVAVSVRDGPFAVRGARFAFGDLGLVLRDRGVRLANLGYLGHMWELYAMWAWVPLCLLASYERAGLDAQLARLAGFAAVGAGGFGAVVAGRLADRLGRTAITSASLAVSGSCCLVAGALFEHPLALTGLCIVWGFAVVADSAQFSAAVTELADPRLAGTALAAQTCVGFLLTAGAIHAVPTLVAALGWRHVFAVLAVGPAVGVWAMLRLRSLPEASRLAGGRR